MQRIFPLFACTIRESQKRWILPGSKKIVLTTALRVVACVGTQNTRKAAPWFSLWKRRVSYVVDSREKDHKKVK